MIHAIKIHKTGGPEVLSWEEYDPGMPGPGEVRIIHEAIGLNFIDVYHRTGLYPLPALPAVLGLEGAGRVDLVGSGVTEFGKGDRVAYAGVPPGAYAEVRCIPAHRLVKLPDAISTRDAAAMMLQGMTARYLLKGCFDVKPGTTMSAADLRVYYAVNFTQANFPILYWDRYCGTYKIFKAFFDKQTDAYMFSMVTTQESHGFDVPDKGTGVPPAPIC